MKDEGCKRPVQVHLLPGLVPIGALRGATAVAIDALRATTTMITALAASCTDIRPWGTVEEAKELAHSLSAGHVLRGGERHNVKIEGFDLGNAPFSGRSDAYARGEGRVLKLSHGLHSAGHGRSQRSVSP